MSCFYFLPYPAVQLSQYFLIFSSWIAKKAIWALSLTYTSFITYMYEHFVTCLFLIFLSFFGNCLPMSVSSWALGIVDWKPTWTGFIGLLSQALVFISRNRIQRTVIPPRDKNWRVNLPPSSSLSCFSLHPTFPFPLGLFNPKLFIPSGFGLSCHLVQPLF